MQTLFDSKGKPVSLAQELGRGGEGAVFAINDPASGNLVAKIYHKPVDGEKAAKIATMARLGTERLLRLTAWPVETLHNKPNGDIIGLLMPKASAQPVHLLYSPKSRLTKFPTADWRFLVHAASNTARAFAAIHDHGHIIGDINHGNLLVSDQGTVMVIDCDSFQITAQGHHYLCEVGVDTYTPPELQGKSFRNVVRTQNHDNFGLAVLIFHLLFIGRHPFAGRYLGPEAQPTLDKLIAGYRFAYGTGAAAQDMETPPNTLSLTAVSEPVAALFERAFADPSARLGARPSPHEWTKALFEFSKQLKPCSRNASHYYWRSVPTCPWCAIEAPLGILLFGFALTPNTKNGTIPFNLTAIWAQIKSVTYPGPPLPLPDHSTLSVSPSPAVIQANAERWKDIPKGSGIFASVAKWINQRKQYVAVKKKFDEEVAAYSLIVNRKRIAWNNISQSWNTSTSSSEFDRCLAHLELLKKQHENLTAQKVQKLQDLQKNARERQLNQYLSFYELRYADLPAIGPNRKSMLRSYGIESAADVTQNAILNVPGFGPALAGTLLTWRRKLEAGFVYKPDKGISPVDIRAIEDAISAQQQPVERELANGRGQLERIKVAILTKRQTIWPRVEEAARELAQAEINLKSLKLEKA